MKLIIVVAEKHWGYSSVSERRARRTISDIQKTKKIESKPIAGRQKVKKIELRKAY